VVDIVHAIPGGHALEPRCPDKGPADGHEDSGRDAFPRHVTYDKSQSVVIHHEIIIEIAPYLSGSFHGSVNISPFQTGYSLGHDGPLNFTCHHQVMLNREEFVMVGKSFPDNVQFPDGFFQGDFQIVEIDRFGYEIKGTPVHGRTDIIHIAVSRTNHSLEQRVFQFTHLAQQGQAIHLGHIDIAQDNPYIGYLYEFGQGFQPIESKMKLILVVTDLSPEFLVDYILEICFVIYH